MSLKRAQHGPPAYEGAATPPRLDGADANWLVAFLRRRFGAQDAEDLAQEAWLHAAQAGSDIRNPRAFLAAVAVNAARMRRRAERARPVLVSDEAAMTAAATPAEQAQALLLKQVFCSSRPGCERCSS